MLSGDGMSAERRRYGRRHRGRRAGDQSRLAGPAVSRHHLYARGIGDHNRNVLAGLCINTVLTALGTAGIPFGREAFLCIGFGLGGLLLLVGVLSDLRSIFAPTGGIGLYFGTFNPVHNTHLAIIQRAMAERRLAKIIIHPTLIPRLLCRGFPQGRDQGRAAEGWFSDLREDREGRRRGRLFPDRQHLPATRDAQGADRARSRGGGPRGKVEVIVLRETYDTRGFQGVIAEIRRQHRACGCTRCTARTSAACTCGRSATNAAGSTLADHAPRQDLGDRDPQGCQGHDAGRRDQRAGTDFKNLPEITAGGRRFRNDNGVLTEGARE